MSLLSLNNCKVMILKSVIRYSNDSLSAITLNGSFEFESIDLMSNSLGRLFV